MAALKHSAIAAAALLCAMSATAQFGGLGKAAAPAPAPVAAPAPAVVAPAAPAPAPAVVANKPAPKPAPAVVVAPKPKPKAAAAPAAAAAAAVAAAPAAAVAAVAAPAPAPKLTPDDEYATNASQTMAAASKLLKDDSDTAIKDAQLRLTIADLSFINGLASISKKVGIVQATEMQLDALSALSKDYAVAQNIEIYIPKTIAPQKSKKLIQDFLLYAGSRAQLTKSQTTIKIVSAEGVTKMSDQNISEMKNLLAEVFKAQFEIITETGAKSSISVVNANTESLNKISQKPLFGYIKSAVTVDLDKTNPIANGIGQLFSLIDKKGQVANMVKQTETIWLLEIKLDNGETISVRQTAEDGNIFTDKARVGLLTFGEKQKAFALVQ